MKNAMTILLFFAVSTHAVADSSKDVVLPKFSEYSIDVYRGKLKIPNYYEKIDQDWRDDMGKLVAPPAINFAGKYYIGIHSCGADCRYHTLSDLTNGSDSNALDMFSNDLGYPQKTSDGRIYITNLVSRPTSNMLIAQYHIEGNSTSQEECRERIFIF
jgi:hypothetical protein